MPVVFIHKAIEPLRNIGGDVSLVTLPTYVGWDIPNDKQLFTTPDFQRRLARPQLTAA